MAIVLCQAPAIITKTPGLTRSISILRMMSGTTATGTPGEGAGKGGGTGGTLQFICLGTSRA